MIFRFLFFTLTICTVQFVQAQGNWLRYAGGTQGEETKDAVFDSGGNLVMAGYFNGTFGTGAGTLTTTGNTDIFVIKSDDAGNPLWAVKAGGVGIDRANAIAADNAGNTYITGYFQSNATFGSINVTGGGWEAYVAKIDGSGNFVWVTTFGGSFGDIGHALTVDNAGNIICTGEYKGTATFGATVLTSMNNSGTGAPTYDVFVVKLNPSGGILWAVDGNANQDDRGLAITTDAMNRIYVGGQYSQTITFQSAHPSTLLNAAFVVSFDANGNELWFDKMWGGQILIADMDWGGNNVYVTGDYQNTLLVEDQTGVQSFPAQDQYNIFTARFSESGNLGWLTPNYSSSELHSTSLILDASNNVYITGDFNCTFTQMNSLYGGSTFLSVGFEDVHYIKFNSSGTFIWGRQAAGNSPDFCEAIAIKNIDKPVLAGYTEGIFYVPAGSTFTFLPGQQVNFSTTNCTDANYGNFAQTNYFGQRDIFWTSPYDANRKPFDYYEKNPGLSCDLNSYEPCIGNEIPFAQCEDTLEGCDPVTAMLNDFMIGNVHPNYTVFWSSGATGLTANFTNPGYYTATTTTEDMCYSWVDSIYIDIYPEPDPPLISDSWGVNLNSADPDGLDSCDVDSVLVWAIPSGPGNDSIVWIGNNIIVNDSTISVPVSGNYGAYAVNEFGCQSDPTGIEIVLNNFALHDTLDPHIIFNDSNIQDTDSTLACNYPFCVSSHLIDSAFTNSFGTLPNLYSIWYLDGVYQDTLEHNSDDSVEVQSPTPYSICVNTSGWHVVEVELWNECGDTVFYALIDSFYVDTIPTPQVSISGPAACPNDTIIVSATFNTSSANWSGTGIIFNYGDSVMAIVNPQGFVSISVSVDTTVQGVTCSNSASFVIPAIPTPQVTIDPVDGVVCPNDSVMFTVTSGIAWQWVGPTGDSLGTNFFQYGTDIGEYFCYVTTAEGCIVLSEFESTVAYSSPILYLWDPVICVDDSALIQVLGPSNTTINWLAPLSGSSFQNYAPDEGWYYCETSFCGITKVDSVFVTVSMPLANFDMPNDTIICPYDDYVITAPPNFAEYYWNGIAGSQNFTVPDSGYYYLSVVDTNGCTDISDSILIAYHALPPPPVASDTTICPNTDAVLNAVGSGTLSWYNSSGTFLINGNTLNVPNVGINTNYLVTNANAFCESVPDTSSITLFIDNVNASINIIDTCGSLNVQVQNIGTPGLTYFWYMGDGTTYTGAVANHTYAGNGTYTVSLVVVDPLCGFNDSTSQQVTVYGQSISVIYNDPTCHQFSDASLTLNVVDAIGGETILIEDIGGNELNPGGTNTANNLTAGWYFYFVNLGPGCTLVDSVLIPDPPALDAAINLFPPPCYGMTGSAVVDTVYNWQGNYNNISFIWNPNPAGVGGVWADSSYNMAAGTYVLTINDDNGCSNNIDFVMPQPDELVFTEFGFHPAHCRLYSYQSGNGVVYAATSGGTPGYTYLWTNLETGAQSNNSTWGGLNPGTYSMVVTDANGCILTQNVELDSVNPMADFDMSSLGFDIQYEGDAPLEVHFENQSLYYANPNDPNADTTFFWHFNYDVGPWTISHDVNETFDTVYTAGTYTICLTAINKNGCSDTMCLQIIVYDPIELTPPNIFTPDGDGSNDEFTFWFLQKGIETFECIIVNRWGVTVKEINDIHSGWDGTDKNGDDCPDGVYFYVYKGVGFNGDEVSGQGSITIVRGN